MRKGAFLCMCSPAVQRLRGAWPTVELGLGQDAAADAEAVLLIADVEGRDGRVVRDLFQTHSRRHM